MSARYDTAGRYLGGASECQHRTVGSHRAWCLSCHQWCYPRAMCPGCLLVELAELDELGLIDEETTR